ncbi:response regulator [Candidatus Peregrinibacteria bacterium]|nr:response regulator [Candidatus Peregrinibacteria bacterium]
MAKTNKILIAEDDPFLIKVMGTILQDEGFAVDTARDGEEALKKITANGYKLVLLDLVMPKKNGFEVLEDMKAKKIKTPVLVFSNLSQDSDRKEAVSLGAKDYFVKSDMSIDEVAEAVKKYISK